MKIQFKSDLSHQTDAVNAVVGVFEGQEVYQTNFSVNTGPQMDLLNPQNDIGVGNALKLFPEEVYNNTRKVQLQNAIKQVQSVNEKLASNDFTVEMETGTGKTYVYLKSIFELNQRYGFTKFIIVVPSIAIKEGVYKSLEITREHFKKDYKNVQCDYFVYDSKRPEELRNFASNDYIQIMVINIDSFNKKESNILLRDDHEKGPDGGALIKFIQSTNPVVIIDEPQSVDTTPKSKAAIASLNPLCTFRYSATHIDQHNMLYKLDSIDAYENQLVKQIEVASLDLQNHHNKAYIKLVKVKATKTKVTAELEIDALDLKTGKLKPRKVIKVEQGSDLFFESGERELYQGMQVDKIYAGKGEEYINLTPAGITLKLGEAINEIDTDQFKRLQVRKTIEEHLNKELAFYHKVTHGYPIEKHAEIIKANGIKVLSLFFIDKVANYRTYDGEGNTGLGKYAQWFTEEFRRLIQFPEYRVVYPNIWEKSSERDSSTSWKINEAALDELVNAVHDGYFAMDKVSKSSNNKDKFDVFTDTTGKTAKDESAYNLIMKDKERLLSIQEPLRFIFSHSALKEGWDNPNVFQICTLNEANSVIKKRQEIGRGLRLAVDQSGERVNYGFEVNTLTVMANESYEDFVEQLQKEIEQEEGIKFGIVESHYFASIAVTNESGNVEFIGQDKSEELFKHLQSHDYIDSRGKVKEDLKHALREGNLILPESLALHKEVISAALKKVAGSLNIKRAEDKQKVTLKKDVLLGDDFKALWERIKHKTTYRVNFDEQKLVDDCIRAIRSEVTTGHAKFQYRKAKVEVEQSGLNTDEVVDVAEQTVQQDLKMPDIVTYLQDQTNLTRKTIVNILVGLGDKLNAFKRNPQSFIETANEVISTKMRHAIVDGITYHKLGELECFSQELFEEKELTGYLNKNMKATSRTLYDHVIYDSDTELSFLESFEKNPNISLYAKLPGWFKIDTPLGGYNPDWAVVFKQSDGSEKLYFIVETKSHLLSEDRREKENKKIECGEKHFAAIAELNDNPAQYLVSNSFENFENKMADLNQL